MKPDYGLDAPGVIRGLLVGGAAALVVGSFASNLHVGPVQIALRPTLLDTGVFCILSGLAMLAYSKFGKFRHRDRILRMVNWKGDEMVLDVGTGRGLLMIGAAQKLNHGKAVGIDIWSKQDLSGNTMENTLKNAELEGVRGKVELRSEDATAMALPNGTFDVVLSNLCLHNIPSREARDRACREIVRVLKPGGQAVISDLKNTGAYIRAFRTAGATAERSGVYPFDTFPPLTIIRVGKPA